MHVLPFGVLRALPRAPASRLAGVAQLVEQLIRNQQVTRSSRVAGSKSLWKTSGSPSQLAHSPVRRWTDGGRTGGGLVAGSTSQWTASIAIRTSLLTSSALRAMCHNVHMKTISIRELHLKTGEWVRHAASRGPIVVTDRGRRVAALQPFDASVTGRPLPNREAAIRKRSKIPVDSAVYQSELREGR